MILKYEAKCNGIKILQEKEVIHQSSFSSERNHREIIAYALDLNFGFSDTGAYLNLFCKKVLKLCRI